MPAGGRDLGRLARGSARLGWKAAGFGVASPWPSLWTCSQEEAHRILDQRHIRTEPPSGPAWTGSCFLQAGTLDTPPGDTCLQSQPPGHTPRSRVSALQHQPVVVLPASLTGGGGRFSVLRPDGIGESEILMPTCHPQHQIWTEPQEGVQKGVRTSPDLAYTQPGPSHSTPLSVRSGAVNNHFQPMGKQA